MSVDHTLLILTGFCVYLINFFGLGFVHSCRAVIRSNCFHKNGHQAKCSVSNYPFMVIFACIELVLSQIPNFHKLSWLSVLAAIMSFTYASIGVGLSIARVAGTYCAIDR